MISEITYTNTGLGTARRCLTEFDLAYNLRLASDDVDSEALQVGQAWHKAFHYAHKESDVNAGYDALRVSAPGHLWNEKLARLYAAHQWYWKDQPFELEIAEHTFKVEFNGNVYEGQIDGIVRLSDGRHGILERKTTGDSLSAESLYWDRLRMDVQVGLYAMACGFVPSFILYDVVRKPTINPKKLLKADLARLRKSLIINPSASYYSELFSDERLEGPLEEERESIEMYGARLTADIGDRPDYYFARREVPRGQADYDMLLKNLDEQVQIIQYAEERQIMHRNPDACATFGRCRFFGLCSNNIRPRVNDPAPDGFHIREHLHPELA